MLIEVLKSKLHRATVTDHNLDYEGSLTIDRELMDLAGIRVYEKIAVFNVTNGNRFETYAIEGPRGRRDICVNGAAAHLARKGDLVIIVAHALVEEPQGPGPALVPRVVRLDADNQPLPDTGPEHAA